MNKLYLLLQVLIFPSLNLLAQNTIGLLHYDQQKSFNGYNLIFPHNQENVYLFDNCGQLVHTWADEKGFVPGNAVYLLPNGNLVKCKRASTSAVNDPIWAGGGGETIEIRNWYNQLLYSYTLNDSLFRLHHDVAPMPNGNILMVLWEKKNYSEAVAVGRDTALLPQKQLWSEAVWEWNPILDSIVWKWSVWDHLIQDHTPQALHYGNVKNNPQRIDVNYDSQDGHPDWLHINSIDYNPVLDQIMLSVPHFDEFWIINHNLSAEAAKSEQGDLMYRWGNPRTYKQATTQKLFFQHDARWLDRSASTESPDFGLVTLFNNRVTNISSSANIIQTPINIISKTYEMAEGVFLPTDFKEVLIHPTNYFKAFSNSLSSFQMLPNGNALICAGRWGYAYELSPTKEIVWEYVIPIKAGSPARQGDTLSINNNLSFRMNRYSVDYPAFQNIALQRQGYIETVPNESFCEKLLPVDHLSSRYEFNIFPNPADTYFTVETSFDKNLRVEVFNLLGQKVSHFQVIGKTTFSTSHWENGIYFLKINSVVAARLLVQHGR